MCAELYNLNLRKNYDYTLFTNYIINLYEP